jgi:hypothetical protein
MVNITRENFKVIYFIIIAYNLNFHIFLGIVGLSFRNTYVDSPTLFDHLI